jgi:hypothetical protein
MENLNTEKWIDQYFGDLLEFDCLEIGALDGGSTKYLSKYFKRVFVIDPWDGRQQGVPTKYNIFLENVQGLTNVYHCRTGSETNEARDFLSQIQDLKLGFCYIDGLHTKEAVINDFKLSSPYVVKDGLVLIDDCDFPPVNDGAEFVKNSPISEDYQELEKLYKYGICLEDHNMTTFQKTKPDYTQSGYGILGSIPGHNTVRVFKKLI